MDPLNPIPIVRQHQARYTDAYGDTWQMVIGIETKVAYRNRDEVLAQVDEARRQCRADLDALGYRDNLGEMEIEVDGKKIFVEGPSPAFGFSMKTQPTEENLARVKIEQEAAQKREEDFKEMLDDLYEKGGSPDIAYINIDVAHTRGIIGPWEYGWLKLRHTIGTWMQNVISGVRSVLPTRGTKKMEKR